MKTSHSPAKRIALWVYLIIILLWVIIPVVYALTGAFRAGDPQVWWQNFWPSDFTTDNFKQAFKDIPLARQFLNSIIVAGVQTFLATIFAILAAAALVFGKLKRKGWIFAFILVTMMIPSEATIASKFALISHLHVFDTLIAIFIPYLASAFSIFLLRQKFLSFPYEVYEAAQIDGAKPALFVFKILVPLCKPTIFAVVINEIIGAWNGYLWPLLSTQSAKNRTIQVGVAQLADAEVLNIGVILAGAVVVIVPMVLLLFAGNKYLVKGLTEGSTK